MENYESSVGKNLIEIFMFSMYSDEKIIYREYIQNAYDSIVDAARQGILNSVKDGNITVTIDPVSSSVRILDNGTGISADIAPRILLNIADSTKNGIDTAGQYGIGRLSGAQYCQRLVFKTSAKGEALYTEVVFDNFRANQIISDKSNHTSASRVIDEITSEKTGIEDKDAHYFEVRMEDVHRAYTKLLNVDVITDYLQEVAPVDYQMEFNNIFFSHMPADFKELSDAQCNVRITVNDKVDIRRRYGLTIEGTNDEIQSLQFFKLNDSKYGLLGWGWYAITSFSNNIPSSDKNRGIRLRRKNIQIGDGKVLNQYFRETRGNNYFYGEIYATNNNLKPSSSRDGLVPTPEANAFFDRIEERFGSMLNLVYTAKNLRVITKDIESKTVLAAPDHSDEDKNNAEKSVLINLEKLNRIKQKMDNSMDEKKPQDEAEQKVLKIYEDRINKSIDSSELKKSASVYRGESTTTTSQVVKDETILEEQTSNDSSSYTDIFEPLSSKYSSDEIRLIRKVFVAFTQNCSIQERKMIEGLKKKVIKALGK